jgi:hypothetical protein
MLEFIFYMILHLLVLQPLVLRAFLVYDEINYEQRTNISEEIGDRY